MVLVDLGGSSFQNQLTVRPFTIVLTKGGHNASRINCTIFVLEISTSLDIDSQFTDDLSARNIFLGTVHIPSAHISFIKDEYQRRNQSFFTLINLKIDKQIHYYGYQLVATPNTSQNYVL